MGVPLRVAPRPSAAAYISSLTGLYTTPSDGRPSMSSPIDTQKMGKPCEKLVVPSSGSICHS